MRAELAIPYFLKELPTPPLKKEKYLTHQFIPVIILLLGSEQIKRSGEMDEEFEKTRQNHAGRLIHMLSHQLKRRSAMPETGTGLTPMQKHVLTYILFETMVRDIYQKDIEKEFKIRRSTASGILQLMEKNGFIYRQSVEKDARLKRILPTAKAEKIRMEILTNIKQTEAKLKEGIPKENFEVCLNVMRQMLENLSEKRQENQNLGGRHEQETF